MDLTPSAFMALGASGLDPAGSALLWDEVMRVSRNHAAMRGGSVVRTGWVTFFDSITQT